MVQLPFLIFADMKQAECREDDVSIEGMRILLVEDNELNMEIAEFLLTNAGAEIIRASNGKEAVEAFEKSGVGKDCYNARIQIENYMCEISIDKTLEIQHTFGEMGIGRELVGVFKRK